MAELARPPPRRPPARVHLSGLCDRQGTIIHRREATRFSASLHTIGYNSVRSDGTSSVVGKRFVLVTRYFSRWMEAFPIANMSLGTERHCYNLRRRPVRTTDVHYSHKEQCQHLRARRRKWRVCRTATFRYPAGAKFEALTCHVRPYLRTSKI
jgi:hypothetical protein